MNKIFTIILRLLKDVFSQKRNILFMIAIGFSAFIIVFGEGYSTGVARQLYRFMRHSYSGDMTIVSSSVVVRSEPNPRVLRWSELMTDPGGYLEEIENRREVEAVLPQIVLFARAMGADEVSNVFVRVIGSHLEKEDDYSFKYMVEFKEKRRPMDKTAYISTKIAEDLGLASGDNLYLFFVNDHGDLIPTRFTVGGIFVGKGFPALSESLVYVGYSEIKRVFNFHENKYSSLRVFLKSEEYKIDFQEWFEGRNFEGWVARKPRESSPFFYNVIEMIGAMNSFFYLMLYLTIFLFIYSTLIIAITNKHREIGIMRAQGLSKSQLFLYYAGEGVLIGLYPAIIGSILGTAGVIYFSIVGIYTDNLVLRYMFASDSLYFRMNWFSLIYSTVGIAVVSFIASILPVRKAVNLKIVDALRDLA